MGATRRYGLDDAVGVVWGSSAWQAAAGAWRDEGGPEAVAAVARAAGRVLVRLGRWLSRVSPLTPVTVTAVPVTVTDAAGTIPPEAPALLAPAPVVAAVAEPAAPVKSKPKRPRKSAVAAVLAERVTVGGSVYFRKGTRYVPCANPAAWDPANGSLYTRHGTGRQTRYTELVPARAR